MSGRSRGRAARTAHGRIRSPATQAGVGWRNASDDCAPLAPDPAPAEIASGLTGGRFWLLGEAVDPCGGRQVCSGG
ncbi:MAG: hypothetical protein AAGK21_09900 [Bacteroidota bacterium]